MDMISRYLNYSTIATKPCTLPRSASSSPAVWLHDLSLHNCGTSTRCCNHMLTSNQERDFCSTAFRVAYSLQYTLGIGKGRQRIVELHAYAMESRLRKLS